MEDVVEISRYIGHSRKLQSLACQDALLLQLPAIPTYQHLACPVSVTPQVVSESVEPLEVTTAQVSPGRFALSCVTPAPQQIPSPDVVTPQLLSSETLITAQAVAVTVGVFVGAKVGVLLGALLGSADDSNDNDGALLCSADGSDDGSVEGALLGSNDGSADGCVDGSLLGPADGCADGLLLGSDDGGIDGAPLGASEASPSRR